MQFRPDYVTLALTEMRAAVKQADPDAVFSTTLIAGEKEDYLKLLHDWPAWIEQGLIDEFYIWFRTNSDLDALGTAATLRGGCLPAGSLGRRSSPSFPVTIRVASRSRI